MSVLIALVVSFVTTLIIGFVAAVLLDLFAPLHSSPFGGFCVALGYLLHRASYSGPANWAALEALATVVGGVLGLVFFWRLKVRQPANDA